ncbi:MAG: OB-fold domain-containing protein [Deltaproteobacteria bacterium]|nr:OB-fold domain-containing protein [Deltaproteobacteria bacterium]
MSFFRPTPALEPRTEAFWRACRAGRLEFTHCVACDYLIHPSRPICPKCRGRNLDVKQVSGRGRVHSYTANHKAWYPGQDVPYLIALVELIEQHGLRLMTNIVDCPIEAVHIGMPVRVRFESLNDEVGLPLFEPEATQEKPPPGPLPGKEGGANLAVKPFKKLSTSSAALERRAIISGVGQSAIGRRLFRDDLDLTCEAALEAIADAGLRPEDIDGIAAYPGPIAGVPGFAGPSIYEVQDALGVDVRWHLSGLEGPAQIMPIIHATLAVAAGLCRHALVYRTVTEATASADTGRRGIGTSSPVISGFTAFFIPYGAMSAANWLALYARRHMHEFGTRREHLGMIATTARRHASLNPKAVYRDPLSMDDYLSARLVSEPFGLYDCDAPVDGSTAVIISSAECARDLPKPAVRFNAVGTAINKRPLWDQWEDITTMASRDAAAHMWSRTDLKPSDVDTAQLYDGFSFLALAWLESLGFCKRGEGGPFVEGGRISLGGELPLNTWGGQLSGGRLHGFGFVAEAARQLRGECGDRQVADCQVAAVGVGGGPVAGALLLTR